MKPVQTSSAKSNRQPALLTPSQNPQSRTRQPLFLHGSWGSVYCLYCFLTLEALNKDNFWFKVGDWMFLWPHSFLHNTLIRTFRPKFERAKFCLWTCVTPTEVDVTWPSDSWGQTSLFIKDVMDKQWFPRTEYNALKKSHQRRMEKMPLKLTSANTPHHSWMCMSAFLACKGTFEQWPQAPPWRSF